MKGSDSPKCAGLHGHTAHVQVTFTSKLNEIKGYSTEFCSLKNILKFCVEKYDHKILVFKDDLVLLEVAQSLGVRQVLPVETTAENLCLTLFEEIQTECLREFGLDEFERFNVKVRQVTFSETPDVWVSYPEI
jgi:6-pyruvoyl-tetrahydropterin synthase